MPRAIRFLLLGLCCAGLLPLRPQAEPQYVNMIDGIGLVDYSRPRDLTVGDWAQYHMTGSSEMGMKDDYVITVLIGGEERFWGDEGFWLETWTEISGRPASVVASLTSYSIFDDSLAAQNLQNYARKLVTEMDVDGNAVQQIRKRADGSLRQRGAPQASIEWYTDTLGTDTVMVPRGTFQCLKVRVRHGVRASVESGDSTFENEVEEHRTRYLSRQIPVTSTVREDVEKWIRRRAWKAGESRGAPMLTREHSQGTARLLDYGTGLAPRLVPVEFRKSLRRQQPARNTTPAKGTRRTAPRKTG
jgi:hypothetical protein